MISIAALLLALAQTLPGSEPEFRQVQCALSNQNANTVMVTPVFDRDVAADMHGIFAANVERLIARTKSPLKARLNRDGAVPARAADAWTGRCWIAKGPAYTMVVGSWREKLDPAEVVGGRRQTRAIEAYAPNWRALLKPGATLKAISRKR
ncbi:hypothetical protein M9978_08775 [Sphingomonas sp. MG17]|uniref:Uncharacterized protein n=1 Tax=Sphingomonas tagetis TaxID=2949092 RepID=A0A9X2HGT4_9SPHN|nr:hypothetical protein [Sphingomonas tagetis]MCP3730523.1 hypothetical protein [Sphingomonas tagetis]